MTTQTTERTAAYELGRARGYVTGRTEADESDWTHLYDGPSFAPPMPKEEDARRDYMEGMLDGAEQARDRKLGLPVPTPPSADALMDAGEWTK